jgi:hypothetical protein
MSDNVGNTPENGYILPRAIIATYETIEASRANRSEREKYLDDEIARTQRLAEKRRGKREQESEDKTQSKE